MGIIEQKFGQGIFIACTPLFSPTFAEETQKI